MKTKDQNVETLILEMFYMSVAFMYNQPQQRNQDKINR